MVAYSALEQSLKLAHVVSWMDGDLECIGAKSEAGSCGQLDGWWLRVH
jgi:hypothetical protein